MEIQKLNKEIDYDINRIENKIDSYETLKISFENEFWAGKKMEKEMREYLDDVHADYDRAVQIRNYHAYELKF